MKPSEVRARTVLSSGPKVAGAGFSCTPDGMLFYNGERIGRIELYSEHISENPDRVQWPDEKDQIARDFTVRGMIDERSPLVNVYNSIGASGSDRWVRVGEGG